ncbi:MAG: hypothetical protein ACI9BD_000661 [Candidatus Marinamargulisbacteria bacterium]
MLQDGRWGVQVLENGRGQHVGRGWHSLFDFAPKVWGVVVNRLKNPSRISNSCFVV